MWEPGATVVRNNVYGRINTPKFGKSIQRADLMGETIDRGTTNERGLFEKPPVLSCVQHVQGATRQRR